MTDGHPFYPTLGVGIHDAVPADVYHADPCERPSLSSSLIKTMCDKSPLHAWTEHPRLNPGFVREDDSKFDVGTVAHALWLEGGLDIVEVVDADSWRSNAAKEQRDAARAAGKVPLLADQYERVQELVEAITAAAESFPADPPLFTGGKAEQTLVWDEDGVLCRARADWLSDDRSVIDDLKTTYSASPAQWSRTLFNIGADIQTAFYLRGLYRLARVPAEFRFVVIETSAPYAMSVHSIGPAALALAERKIAWAIDTWRECLAADRWPGYPERVCWAEPTPWQEADWLDKEAMNEEAA